METEAHGRQDRQSLFEALIRVMTLHQAYEVAYGTITQEDPSVLSAIMTQERAYFCGIWSEFLPAFQLIMTTATPSQVAQMAPPENLLSAMLVAYLPQFRKFLFNLMLMALIGREPGKYHRRDWWADLFWLRECYETGVEPLTLQALTDLVNATGRYDPPYRADHVRHKHGLYTSRLRAQT